MSDCQCKAPADGSRFWCERHRVFKTAHWAGLCRTQENYRAAWEAGTGPGQVKSKAPASSQDKSHYLVCQHRGDVIGKTTGNFVGCGCGGTLIEFYECKHFSEPVLKDCKGWAWRGNKEKLQAACPTFSGRTCRGCAVMLALSTETSHQQHSTPLGQPATDSAAVASRLTTQQPTGQQTTIPG